MSSIFYLALICLTIQTTGFMLTWPEPDPSKFHLYRVPNSRAVTQWMLEKSCCVPIELSEQILDVIHGGEPLGSLCANQVTMAANLKCERQCQDEKVLISKACNEDGQENKEFKLRDMAKICCVDKVAEFEAQEMNN